MKYKLFLDDERDPVGEDWVIARSYIHACIGLVEKGFPRFISFDHDLGEGMTGYDFARELIQYDMAYDEMPEDFDFYVHSQNPVGKENIEKLLNNYLESKKNG